MERFGGLRAECAVNPSAMNPSPGRSHREDAAPVIPACLAVEFWRVPELGHPANEWFPGASHAGPGSQARPNRPGL